MSDEMEDDKQLRDIKGRFQRKENPKKYRIRVTSDEKRLIESFRKERIDVYSLLGIRSREVTLTTPMRLILNILLRAGTNFESLIVETVRGEYLLDLKQLKEVILKLTKICKTMEYLDTIKFSIPESAEIDKEEDLEAIQHRLRLRPVQQVLHALKFMNRLDEVLLLSLKDPDFLVHASGADFSEIQPIITLLDKSNDLRLIPP